MDLALLVDVESQAKPLYLSAMPLMIAQHAPKVSGFDRLPRLKDGWDRCRDSAELGVMDELTSTMVNTHPSGFKVDIRARFPEISLAGGSLR